MLILISGVVLLTHKKPEHTSSTPVMPSRIARGKGKADAEEGRSDQEGEQEVLWTLGEDVDGSENGLTHLEEEDPDVDHHQNPIPVVADGKGKNAERVKVKGKGNSVSWKVNTRDEEGVGLIGEDDAEEEESTPIPYGSSSNPHSTVKSRPLDQYQDEDEFGNWEGGTASQR